MSLYVEDAALIMSVQDSGRTGYQRFGMPVSGPMDWRAHRSANFLVGNLGGSACVEIGFSSCQVIVERDVLLSVCGAGFNLSVNGRDLPMWTAAIVKSGDILRLEKIDGGNWAYLAVAGGFETPLWLHSRSVFPRAGLGHLLIAGERLPVSVLSDHKRLLAGRSLPLTERPVYSQTPTISVIPGPHQDRFTAEAVAAFFDGEYRLSHKSDRMGYRLKGRPLAHKRGADLVSQGMALGQIQVPADGQPIVMMPDHPTTGGYTSIGTISRADLPLLAQAQPERSVIRFRRVDTTTAVQELLRINQSLTGDIFTQEDSWLGL